ncbi:hypothetical protein Tco_1342860 [Tanacetum coccineum]
MALDGNDQDAEYAISKLLQIGTMEDYQWEFEMLIKRVTIPESLLKSPLTLGEDFFKAHIPEARFEIIAKEDKVVDGGEVLGIGEDDDLGDAPTDGGDDAVESGDMSIINSLIGHRSLKRYPGFAQEGGFVCAYDEGNVEMTTTTTTNSNCGKLEGG